ncbi:hypothetical protein VNO77_04695 [Canavalia gladiata]|uniref:Uncharacterized protein n=1 Tax=Canavalia gladiata TaxID=3824 RepID=A0AAN9N228_CANGL
MREATMSCKEGTYPLNQRAELVIILDYCSFNFESSSWTVVALFLSHHLHITLANYCVSQLFKTFLIYMTYLIPCLLSLFRTLQRHFGSTNPVFVRRNARIACLQYL